MSGKAWTERSGLPGQGGHPTAGGVVLIVEDDEPIALALGTVVEEFGHRVLYARDGQEALTLAQREDIALIVTDLMMPRMSGERFLLKFRAYCADHRRTIPPVIVMSAVMPKDKRELAADAYLPKPFDVVEVEQLLVRFL